jgi:cholinesterase
VDYYQYAWKQNPIAQAFIQQSGTAQSFYDPPPNNNLPGWWNATMKLGCGGEGTNLAWQVTCMRTKTFSAIEAAVAIPDPLQAVLGSFGPTVDHRIVFNDYSRRGQDGDFIQRPLLIGNTFNEAGLFKVFAKAGGDNISESEWGVFNQGIFQCPTSTAASYRVRNGVDVFRYLYFGVFPNLVLTHDPPSGAYHTSDIPIVFNTAANASGVPDTYTEQLVESSLQNIWAEFAKDPQNALQDEKYSFPEYNSRSKCYIPSKRYL